MGYLSRRFLLERYLDLSEEEMTRNSELWTQENGEVSETEAPLAGARAMGISNAGVQQDMETFDQCPLPSEIHLFPGFQKVRNKHQAICI